MSRWSGQSCAAWVRRLLLACVVLGFVFGLSIARRQAQLARDVNFVRALSALDLSIHQLDEALTVLGERTAAERYDARWRRLAPRYEDAWRRFRSSYRAQARAFDPRQPAVAGIRDFLRRAHASVARMDALHTSAFLSRAALLEAKGSEARFLAEMTRARSEVQGALDVVRQRLQQLSAGLAREWEVVLALAAVSCLLATALTILEERRRFVLVRGAEVRQPLDYAPEPPEAFGALEGETAEPTPPEAEPPPEAAETEAFGRLARQVVHDFNDLLKAIGSRSAVALRRRTRPSAAEPGEAGGPAKDIAGEDGRGRSA